MADGPLQQAPTLPGSPQPGNVKQDTRRTVSFYTGDTLELMRVSVPKELGNLMMTLKCPEITTVGELHGLAMEKLANMRVGRIENLDPTDFVLTRRRVAPGEAVTPSLKLDTTKLALSFCGDDGIVMMYLTRAKGTPANELPERQDRVDPRSFLETWLEKKGAHNRSWKKRFCILLRDRVSYFRKKEDIKAAGHVPLSGSSIVLREHKPDSAGYVFFSLRSSPQHPRRFLFRCKSEETREEWIKVLEGRIDARRRATRRYYASDSDTMDSPPVPGRASIKPRPPGISRQEEERRRKESSTPQSPVSMSLGPSKAAPPPGAPAGAAAAPSALVAVREDETARAAAIKLQALARGLRARNYSVFLREVKQGFRFFAVPSGIIESFDDAERHFAATPHRVTKLKVQHNCVFFEDIAQHRITMRTVIARMTKPERPAEIFPLKDAEIIVDEAAEGSGEEAAPRPRKNKHDGHDWADDHASRARRRRSTFRQEGRSQAPELDMDAAACYSCRDKLDGFDKLREHCHHCGHAFCSSCLDSELRVPIVKFGIKERVSVCDACFETLLLGDTARRSSTIKPLHKRRAGRPSMAWSGAPEDQDKADEEEPQELFMFLVKMPEQDLWVGAFGAEQRKRACDKINAIIQAQREYEALRLAQKEESKRGMQLKAQWELNFQDIKIEQKIGSGAAGDVFKGSLWGKAVAVKTLKKLPGTSSSDLETELKKEAAILSQIRHPSLVLYMGACSVSPDLCIVTEWAHKGSMYDLIHSTKLGSVHFPVQFITEACLQIAQGCNYLHQLAHPIIHRDLKSQNVLVDRNMNMKIADFGLSYMREKPKLLGGSNRNKRLSVGFYGIMGTPEWMAPEMLLGRAYNESVDVYSFGVVVCEMLSRIIPFHDKYKVEDWRDIVTAVVDEGSTPTIPPWTPKPLKKLLYSCLRRESNRRPAFASIITNLTSFLASYDPVAMFLEFDVRRLCSMLKSTVRLEQQRAASEIADTFSSSNGSCRQCGNLGAHEVKLPPWSRVKMLHRLSCILEAVPPCPEPSEADLPLPDGWRQGVSPEGKPFYYHRQKNKTTWKKPKDKLAKKRKRARARDAALCIEACRALAQLLAKTPADQLGPARRAVEDGGGLPVLLQLANSKDEAAAEKDGKKAPVVSTATQDHARRAVALLSLNMLLPAGQQKEDDAEVQQPDEKNQLTQAGLACLEPTDLDRFKTVVKDEMRAIEQRIAKERERLDRQVTLLAALEQFEEQVAEDPPLRERLQTMKPAPLEYDSPSESSSDSDSDSDSDSTDSCSSEEASSGEDEDDEVENE